MELFLSPEYFRDKVTLFTARYPYYNGQFKLERPILTLYMMGSYYGINLN